MENCVNKSCPGWLSEDKVVRCFKMFSDTTRVAVQFGDSARFRWILYRMLLQWDLTRIFHRDEQVVNQYEADVEAQRTGNGFWLFEGSVFVGSDPSMITDVSIPGPQEAEMKFVKKSNASVMEQVQLIKKKATARWPQ